MSKPNKEGPPDQEGGLSLSEKALIDENFDAYLLDVDVGNALMTAIIYARLERFEDIEPLRTYEEYLRDKASKHKNPGAYYDYVMSKSDSALVEEYNAGIKAFNEKLEEIKRKKDARRTEEILDKLLEILRTERK